MKKRVAILLIGVITLALIGTMIYYLSAKRVNNNKDTNTTTKAMTKDETIKRLNTVNSHITDLWNNVFCEIKWYSDEETSAIGTTIDIDFVVENMDKYYNKVKDDKPFIDNLGDEYSDIKNAFDKMLDKATIIYNHVKEETPKANTELSYRSEIDLFYQYQNYLWETIVNLYNEQFFNE